MNPIRSVAQLRERRKAPQTVCGSGAQVGCLLLDLRSLGGEQVATRVAKWLNSIPSELSSGELAKGELRSS